MPEPESTKSRLKDKYHRPNKLKAKKGKNQQKTKKQKLLSKIKCLLSN